MAILSSIRKQGIFLIIIIALALFAFVLSGILTPGGNGPKGGDTIATINGTDLPRQDFMEEVELIKGNLGPNASSTQAMNMVWERELRRVILEEQIEKLGLSVEKDQLNSALRNNLANNPTFSNEAGQFDEGKMQEYIASIQTSSPQQYQQWLDFEKNTAQSILQTTYFNMIKGGLVSTIAEGEQQFRFENDKVNIEYVHVPFTKISDEEVKVTDDEIKKYIESRSKEYKVEAQADIQYVFFSEEPSEEDMKAYEENMTTLLDSKIEYNSTTKMNDTVAGFKNTANYEEFVNANSDQPFMDFWMFKKDLPPAVADTLINLNEGSVYGPFQVENTYNISKVIAVKQMPDSVQSKHILIRYLGTTSAGPEITKTKEEAKKLADSLLVVVKKDPAKFEALVTEFSDDSSKDTGGDLGKSWPGRMVAPFDEFIFDNPTGTTGFVETDFGYHIVTVGEQTAPQKAIKLATVTKNIEASEKSISDIFTNASTFEVAVQKEEFIDVAKNQNLEVKPVNKMGIMDANIPGIGANREIVIWAFSDDAEVGDTKRFSVPEGYVIAQVTRKNEKGLMSVSEASATVTPILRDKKKAEKIRASISGNTLQEIAANQKVTVQTGTDLTMANPMIPNAGLEPAIIGSAFGKKAGETTSLIDGKTGVFKVRVTAVNKAPEMTSYSNYAEQLTAKTVPAVNSNVYNALKNAADIEDNRASFF